MRFSIGVSTILIVFGASAQDVKHLTSELLNQLERSCPADPQLRAAQHALAQVDGNKIAQNWEKIIGVDQYFSLRLKDQKITDQKGTGRCWMFSGLNILRPVVTHRLGAGDIELSQNFLYFYEKLEKANLFLEGVIATRALPYSDRRVEYLFKQTVQDGQNWLGFIELVRKYGVVPKEVMPETYSSSNSAHLIQVLSLRLKQAAMRIRRAGTADEIAALKLKALKDVYRILAANFGIPPREFTWRYETSEKKLSPLRTYTPVQFFQELAGDVLEEYYPLYSIPTLPFNRKYEIEMDRTVSDQPDMYFVNCSLETMKDLARTSLLDSTAVWFGCDVGQQSSSESGLMIPRLYDYESLYGMDFSLSREELFETYSSVPNHNMVFTGIDIVGDKANKWLVENSWGENRGKQGYFTMLDDWFDKYVQVVVIHKKYMPKELLALYKTPATVLPPWDPMVRMVEPE